MNQSRFAWAAYKLYEILQCYKWDIDPFSGCKNFEVSQIVMYTNKILLYNHFIAMKVKILCGGNHARQLNNINFNNYRQISSMGPRASQ